LDEVVGLAAEDVAQRGEGVHAQPLRGLGDQPEDLFAGQFDAAFGKQWHQVGGGVHALFSHPQPQVPLVAHLADHDIASCRYRSAPCWSRSTRVSSRLRYSSETAVYMAVVLPYRCPAWCWIYLES